MYINVPSQYTQQVCYYQGEIFQKCASLYTSAGREKFAKERETRETRRHWPHQPHPLAPSRDLQSLPPIVGWSASASPGKCALFNMVQGWVVGAATSLDSCPMWLTMVLIVSVWMWVLSLETMLLLFCIHWGHVFKLVASVLGLWQKMSGACRLECMSVPATMRERESPFNRFCLQIMFHLCGFVWLFLISQAMSATCLLIVCMKIYVNIMCMLTSREARDVFQGLTLLQIPLSCHGLPKIWLFDIACTERRKNMTNWLKIDKNDKF